MDRAKSNAKTRANGAKSATLIVPILRHSQQAIARLSKRQSTSISHLQQAAIADPSVAVNLFAKANALLIASGRSPVTDIQRAISFLGVQDFFTHIANADILEDGYQDIAYKSKTRILSRAHHAAHQAQAIARFVGGISCDQVLAATLTQGTLDYIANPSEFKSLLPSPADDPKVTPIFRTCVDLGIRWARATDIAWDEKILGLIIGELGELCRRNEDVIRTRMLEITLETARASDHFCEFLPVTNLMSAGLSGNNAGSNIVQETPNRRTTISDSAENRTPKSDATLLVENKPAAGDANSSGTHKLESVIDRFSASTRGKSDVAALLTTLLAIARDQLQMRLAVLLIFDKSKGTLRAGLHSGIKLPENVTKAKIDPVKNKLLRRILGAPHLVHWQPPGSDGDLNGLMQKFVGDEPAVLYSLYSHGKPFAVILACRPQRGTRLSSAKLKSLRELGGAAMTALDSRPRKVTRPAA